MSIDIYVDQHKCILQQLISHISPEEKAAQRSGERRSRSLLPLSKADRQWLRMNSNTTHGMIKKENSGSMSVLFTPRFTDGDTQPHCTCTCSCPATCTSTFNAGMKAEVSAKLPRDTISLWTPSVYS